MNKAEKGKLMGTTIICIIVLIAVIGLVLMLSDEIANRESQFECLESWRNYTNSVYNCKLIADPPIVISDYRCQLSDGLILAFKYPDSIKQECSG